MRDNETERKETELPTESHFIQQSVHANYSFFSKAVIVAFFIYSRTLFMRGNL